MNMFQLLSSQEAWMDPIFLIPFLIWTIFWKGNALLIASRKSHLTWFWVLMIANTMGILEILYILFFSKTKEELKQMTQKLPTRKYFSKTKQTPEQTPASEITEEDKN